MYHNKHVYIFLMILGIGFGILILMLYMLKKYKNKNEYFSLSLSSDVTEKLRKEKGLEKCDLLFRHVPDMSNKNHVTMTHYIDGLRLRKWKPNENENENENKNNQYDYCYLYNDPANNTQDFILTDSACSKDNILFQSPLIENVFETNTLDKSHKIPIKKCVLEINKEKLKDQGYFQDFWKNWSTSDCLNISSDLRNDLKKKETEKNALQVELQKKEKQLEIENFNINVSQLKLSSCLREKESILNKIDDVNANYTKINEQRMEIENTINTYTNDIIFRNGQIDELNREIDQKNDQISNLQKEFQLCEENNSRCIRDKKEISIIIEDKLKRNEHLKFLIEDLNEKLEQYEYLYQIISQEYEKCNNEETKLENELQKLNNDYVIIENRLKTCKRELQNFMIQYENDKENFESTKRSFENCDDSLKVLKSKFENCKENVSSCVKNLNNTIFNFNENNRESDDEYKDCDNYNNLMNNKEKEYEESEKPLGKNTEVGSMYAKDLKNEFTYVEDLINRLRAKISCKTVRLNSCHISKESLKNKIEELEKRREKLISDIDYYREHQNKMKNDSYRNVSNNVKNETNKIREDYMKIHEKQLDENIKNQCSLDTLQLNDEYQTEHNEHKRLQSKLSNISKNIFDKTCSSDCDISLPQCMIHKNNVDICNINLSGVMNINSANSIKNGSVKITVYDQMDDIIEIFEFDSPDKQATKVSTSTTDLKFFVYESSPPTPFSFSYVACSNGLKHDSDANKCPNNSEDIDKSLPYQIDTISRDTPYRKVDLHRGITCVKFFSSEEALTYAP